MTKEQPLKGQWKLLQVIVWKGRNSHTGRWNMDIEKALQQYMEAFDENYPLVATMGMSDDEIIDDIEQCIQSGTPAEPPAFEEDVDY